MNKQTFPSAPLVGASIGIGLEPLQNFIELNLGNVVLTSLPDDDFLNGLTDEALQNAHPVPMGRTTDTREIFPAEGQNFVFDWTKSGLW